MDDRIWRSRKQEKDGARRFGGTRNAGSGNQPLWKNDVRTGTESIEFKNTDQAGYRLTRVELENAWRYALMDGRRVLFGIEFTRMNLAGAPRRYAMPRALDV